MRHISWHRRGPALTTLAAVSTLALLPVFVIGADSAAAAPAAGYTASRIVTGHQADSVAINAATDTGYFGTTQGTVVVDLSTSTVTGTITVTNPRGIAVDQVTDTIYATTGTTLNVINGATNQVTATIALPGGVGSGVAVDSSTDIVYVAEQAASAVAVIDGSTNSVITTVSLGADLNPFAMAMDETTDVVWVGETSGHVLAISGATNSVTHAISLGTSIVESVAVNPNTDTVYAAPLSGGLAVIDGATGTVSTRIAVTDIFGVAVDPGSDTVFATSYNTGRLGTTWVIDATSNAIADTIVRGGSQVAVNITTGFEYEAPWSAQGNAVWVLTPSATNAMSPVITSSAATLTAGTAGSVTIQGSALPAATYSETGTLPAGVTFSPSGTFSGTPAPGTGGAYPITLTASNGVAPDYSAAFVLSIDEAPTLTAPSATTVTAGSAVSVPIQVTGYPAPTVAASGDVPSGLSVTQAASGSWELSGTLPPGLDGVYQFGLQAINAAGSSPVKTITVTIQEAPSFTSAATATFVTGSDNVYPLSVLGYPLPTITASSLPAGVQLVTGILQGDPAPGSAGTYKFTITATNSLGTATQAFTLNVVPVAVAGLATGGVPYAQAPQLGAGWHSLGGQLAAVPAVAAAPNPGGTTPARPWFIAPGTNHLLYIRTLTGAWARLGPNDASCLSAAAVITSGVLQVACQTTGHGLSYNTAAIPATGMPRFTTAWKSLGGTGTITAGPAIARVNGTLTFFVLATDGKIHTRTIQTGYTPTPWSCLGQPAAATQAATGITYFACQSPSHTLQQATSTATGWNPLTQLPGTLAAGPGLAPATAAVILELENTNHLIYQGTPGTPYTRLGTLQVTGVQAAALN